MPEQYSAAATDTQQPSDLALIFWILEQMASIVTAKDYSVVDLADTIQICFSTTRRKQGLNLDGIYVRGY